MELDLEEREPTVLEYARFHSLCADFTQDQPPFSEVQSLPDDAFYHDLQDLSDIAPSANVGFELTGERLAVSRESVLLLKSVHSLQELPQPMNYISDTRRRIAHLKQEVPLLRSDNELDLLNFGSADLPSLIDLKIPLEPMDEENDEGCEWPSRYSNYPAQCYEQVQAEKLAITRDVLLYIQDTVRDAYTLGDSEKIKAEGLTCKKRRAVQPVTPPLLPISPPMTPYIPSSPANRLETLSEESNSTAAEAKVLEEQIMTADALVRHDSNDSDQMLLEMVDIAQMSPGLDKVESPRERKAKHLKMEGPLTPPILSESPTKKLRSVTFAEIAQIIPRSPSIYLDANDLLSPEDDLARFYEEIEQPTKEAKLRIENERLSDADTTKRASIPYVDFALPVAPWDEYKRKRESPPTNGTEINSQTKFLLWVKRAHMRSAQSWHGLSKLDRELQLEPFPIYPGMVLIEEKLHGEMNLSPTLFDWVKGEKATSSTSIWKKEGLRVLEDNENEEELQPSEELLCKDGDALTRKRKSGIEEVASSPKLKRYVANSKFGGAQELLHPNRVIVTKGNKASEAPPTPQHSRRSVLATQGNTVEAPIDSDTSLMFGGKFSASAALENFMAMHGMTAKQSKKHLEDTPNQPTSTSTRPPIHSIDRSDERSRHNPPIDSLVEAKPRMHPQPKLPSLQACSFIMSSTLLQKRGLSKQIESLYPSAEFVSRDFNLPHSIAEEADLLLSPSTGLIVTTLQQAKQRALPGHSDHSPIKRRIFALQYRYERLVLIISEGLSQDMENRAYRRPVDTRDQEAVAYFEKATSQVENELIVRYVPGGEQALARSIVEEMAKYGLPHGSSDTGDIKPLPDETNWELILRRAGFNPFAAQVILALLKDTVDYPLAPTSTSESVPTFGLQTFLMMPAEQRVANFQAVLGGSRILKRVNALLDQEWVSAAHGFRM